MFMETSFSPDKENGSHNHGAAVTRCWSDAPDPARKPLGNLTNISGVVPATPMCNKPPAIMSSLGALAPEREPVKPRERQISKESYEELRCERMRSRTKSLDSICSALVAHRLSFTSEDDLIDPDFSPGEGNDIIADLIFSNEEAVQQLQLEGMDVESDSDLELDGDDTESQKPDLESEAICTPMVADRPITPLCPQKPELMSKPSSEQSSGPASIQEDGLVRRNNSKSEAIRKLSFSSSNSFSLFSHEARSLASSSSSRGAEAPPLATSEEVMLVEKAGKKQKSKKKYGSGLLRTLTARFRNVMGEKKE